MDYKKILEGVVNIINTTEKSDIGFANICTYIGENCPELTKSEDERIKKEIIEYIKTGTYHKSWIAWLEKQGEQEKPQVYETEDSEIITYSETDGYKVVEPKFNVGDWITNGEYTWKVTEIKPLDYILQSQDGNIVDDTISHVDEQFHSFTIEDAKAGDVLCDYHEAFNNPLIFILKKFEHVDFGLVRPSDYSSYCFLTAGDRQRFKEGTYHHEHNIKPATKEQRNLLFKKMHEAGYEWDADKKELKKIEQKSAWSKEDEKIIRRIDSLLYSQCKIHGSEYEEIHNWLKSLKPQNRWKPSDEQMDALETAISPMQSTTLESLYNDLKKL